MFQHQEQLFEPISGRCEGVPVVSGVSVDADVPEDVQAVFHPFTDGDLVTVGYRARNGRKCLSTCFTVVTLYPISNLSRSAEISLIAVRTYLRTH